MNDTWKTNVESLPITAGLILYLFLGGTLYLLGYWTTFSLDLMSFVSIEDIPKSFIYPFVVAFGVSTLNFSMTLLNVSISDRDVIFKDRAEGAKSRMRKLIEFWWELLPQQLLLAAIFLGSFGFNQYYLSPIFWWAEAILVYFAFSVKAERSRTILKLLPVRSLRLLLTSVLIPIPIFSFVIGKMNALKVYNNERISIVHFDQTLTDSGIAQNGNDSLKLIGFVGDKVIVGSLDNETKIIVNQKPGGYMTVLDFEPRE